MNEVSQKIALDYSPATMPLQALAIPDDCAGMRLDAAQLASLSGLSQLRLRSFGAIDLYGSVALGAASVRRLELDAGALRGHGSVGDVARLQNE